MNIASLDGAALALRRARRAAAERAMRAAMTPTERALYLQRRRDRYRSRQDAASHRSAQIGIPSPATRSESLSSLGAGLLAAPSVFASTSDNLQPLFPSQVDAVASVLQTHVDHEVLRMFGHSFHCRLDANNSELAVDIGLPPVVNRTVVDLPFSAESEDDLHSDVEVECPPAALMSPVRTNNSTSRRRSPLQRSSYNCARNYIDSPMYEPFVLPPPKLCPHCNAKLFPFESSALCCKKGQICLPYRAPPAELLSLYTGVTSDARHFQSNQRAYNHVFSFTSMGVHLDAGLASGTNGIYTYRAQGAVYHRIGSLLPRTDERPRFMQLYVFDTDHEIQNRLAENDSLRPQVLALLKQILDDNNVFVRVLRRMSTRPDVGELRLQLKESRSHGSQYSLPSESEVAAVLIGAENPSDVCDRDVIVETFSGQLLNVPDTAGFYDPLQYPLLHPYGEFGWDLKLHSHFTGSTLSCRSYYCYMFQIRSDRPSLLLHSRRLFQQFAVDTYVKIATQKLRYIRDHQVKIRAELYSGIRDSILNGETHASNVGRRFILPASYIGSPRDMHKRYYDAMAVVQKFGKPDLFITMTCNPKWPEILRELAPGQTAQDRPDVTVRIFHSKCEELKQDLFTRGVLGRVVARVHVIEFQKRGLPHVHILLILADADKLRTPTDYDSVVRADIPDKNVEPDLFRIVMKHMIHGPCGVFDPKQSCMKITGCKRFFPRPYADVTEQGDDSYAVYKRPRLGPQVEIRPDVFVDCRWVVPYNPWLLRKFDCHLNVEVCSTIKCVKYLYKYVYKGSDRCSMEVSNSHDEIKQHVDGRWVSAQEALWRIFRFPLNKIYPAVYSMQVHLHNMHEVHFPDDQLLEDLIHRDSTKKTMLTEFFYKNSVDPLARQYLYREFPEHYTWSSRHRCWNDRIAPQKVIGRLHTVTPGDPERYYMRLLLNHVRGPTSFESLRTVVVNDQPVVLPTYKAAAEKLGLLERDTATRDCLLEAAAVKMPAALTQLFGSLLIFCAPVDAPALWDEFKEFMAQKYPQSATPVHAINAVLADLQSSLEEHGKSLSNFGLPCVPDSYFAVMQHPKEIAEELTVDTPRADFELYEKLNSDQRAAFHTIVDAATHVPPLKDVLYFIDGPGGTGKTFLYRALLAHFRSHGMIAIATATSGLAAIMMPGGRTAHSRFKIPVPVSATSTCKIGAGSGLARLLAEATVIIWDEATLGHRHVFEALDRSLRDIMKSDHVFGGKLIVFGGDFRQVLPIISHGSRSAIVGATLRQSYIWSYVTVISLTQNMRALEDSCFSDFLLRIGDGTETTYAPDTIKVPDSITLPWMDLSPVDENLSSVDELIATIFPSLSVNAANPDFMINRALLTTTNAAVDDLNEKVLANFPGEIFSYLSYDSVENDPQGLYQMEFLNSMNQGTLPPHQLSLKIGVPIMLTRNVEPRKGLCNGTRLICRHFYPNMIDAEFVSGTFKGSTTFLHRIPLNSTPDMNLPFSFTRKQFPIRLSFVLTIHKAQGQTIPFTGVYLPHEVFAHGQLYVALSRGTSADGTRILVKNGSLENFSGVFTKNIVYHEVLLDR